MKLLSSLFLLVASLMVTPVSVLAIGNPVKISNSTNAAVGPEIVSDANGYMHTIYMEVENENTNFGNHANAGIFYSKWNGDAWSTPLKISENIGFAEVPGIAVDSANTVHTVWDDETYGSGIAKAAYKTRTSSGTWSAIETLPSATGTGYNLYPRVAIGSSNVPNVVYSGVNETYESSYYWTQKVSGNWTAPTAISMDESNNLLTTCTWAEIKSDTSGNLHLIYWCYERGPFIGGIFYRKYSAGSWSTPVALALAHDIEFTRMSVTPAGQVFTSWFQGWDKSVRARWTIAGTWQTATTLTNVGDKSIWGYPIMGVTTDSKERAHVGWGERDAENLIDIKFKTYVPGSGWGAAQDVDLDNNDADSPFVYPDKWDNQHFAWAEKNPSTNQWEIYYRAAEGTVQSVTTAGATITVNPNNVTQATLAIPNGALSATTQIGIQIGPVPESVGTTQVTIPRSFTFRPNGLVFNTASTATVFYTDAEIVGVDERQLKPWFWNGTSNLWEARTGTVNRAQNKIAVTLNGFSLYGISAPLIAEPIWLSPTPNETIKQGAKLVEFELTYKDGTPVVPPAAPDELKLVLKNDTGIVMQTLLFEPGGLQKDEKKNLYKGTLNFQKDKLANGVYTLEVYLADTFAGSATFIFSK